MAKPSGMVNGLQNFIMNLKNDFQSDYIIFALDSKEKTFRSENTKSYKANRKALAKRSLEAAPVCIEMIEKWGFVLSQKVAMKLMI